MGGPLDRQTGILNCRVECFPLKRFFFPHIISPDGLKNALISVLKSKNQMFSVLLTDLRMKSDETENALVSTRLRESIVAA